MQIPTFPLVVRKKLEVGVMTGGWLAWRQLVPVGLAAVGVLITAARTQVLEKSEREEKLIQTNLSKNISIFQHISTYTSYNLNLFQSVARLILLPEIKTQTSSVNQHLNQQLHVYDQLEV